MKNLRNVLCLVVLIILFTGCDGVSLSEQIGKDVRSAQSDFEKGYKPTKRETIGMSATIIYLQETNQLDSVTIDLYRLLQIQDSVNIQKQSTPIN